MVTMYNRSCVAVEQAKDALNKVGRDDAYLDLACFLTQQAIEFLMKAILSEYGVAYDKTHDILALLELLRSINFEFEQEDSLELLATTITDWEESSRYGKGIRTGVQTVQSVHNIYKSMNAAFLQKVEENNMEADSGFDFQSKKK